jgi:hypothetical protein
MFKTFIFFAIFACIKLSAIGQSNDSIAPYVVEYQNFIFLSGDESYH